MIAILLQAHLRMAWNQVGTMSWFERLAYGFVLAGGLGLYVLFGRLLFDDPAALFSLIETCGIESLNVFTLVLIHLLFLADLTVFIREMSESFLHGEAPFLNEFPHSPIHLFGFQTCLSGFRIGCSMAILAPLFTLHAFYYYKVANLGGLMLFLAGFAVFWILSLCFFANLVIVVSTLIGKLLTLVKQRTLIILFLLLNGVLFLQVFLPVIVKPALLATDWAQSLPLFLHAARAQGGIIGFVCAYSPVSGLLHLLTFPFRDDFSFLKQALLLGVVFPGTFFLSFKIRKVFFFDDLGSLLENIQLKQASSRSATYFFPLNRLRALARGILYEESLFFRRKMSLPFLLYLAPMLVLPFVLPTVILSMLPGQRDWFYLLNIGMIELLFLQIITADLAMKESFFPLLCPLPVKLHDFFLVKGAFLSLAVFLVHLVCLAGWGYAYGFRLWEWTFATGIVLVMSFSVTFLAMGLAVLGTSLLSSKRLDGQSPDLPLPVILLVYAGFVPLFLSLFLPIRSGNPPALAVALVFWLFAIPRVFRFAFHKL
jgi:hypothetical protein